MLVATAVASASRPPTVEEARAAAAAIGAAHPDVARVMLFGSVARGEAVSDSDIDLVVLIDDLGDYRDRGRLARRLADAARSAASHRVDVQLSDLVEWRTRTGHVSASFEASLAGELVSLLQREPQTEPDWGKPMSRAATNLAEATNRCRDMRDHLQQLTERLIPGRYEAAAEDSARREEYLRNRRRHVCGHAADAIEVAIKTVIVTSGISPARKHDIGELLEQVEPASLRHDLSEIIRASSVNTEEMSAWHVKANYANDVEQQWVDAEVQLPGMVQLAHDMAVHARDAFTAVGGSHLLCQEVDEALVVLRREAPPLTGAEIVRHQRI